MNPSSPFKVVANPQFIVAANQAEGNDTRQKLHKLGEQGLPDVYG
jgi:hypothetical protein